jgi:hypothetical protein
MEGASRARLAVALLAVAGLSGMLAGCGAGSEFQPSNLPGTGGGGAFIITTTTLEDGVVNRSYSKSIATVGGTPPVTSCSIVAGALPPGMNVGPSGAQCVLFGTPGAAGTFNFTLRADDSSLPVRTDTQDYTLVIRQEYSITTPAPDPLPSGVEDRAYNFAFTVMTNTVSNGNDVGQVGEFGNGPLTNCAVTGLPTGMTSMVSNLTANSCQVTIGGTPNIGLVAGSMPQTFFLTLAVTDSSIGGSNVPARTLTQTAIDLTIQPPLSFTLTTGGTLSTPPAGQAPVAVNGRTYGAPAALDLVFTASGGLQPYTWTNTSGAADPDPFVCTQPAPGVPLFLCNSNNLPITTPGGTQTVLTVQVQDSGPGGNMGSAPGTQSTDVNGHAAHGIFVNGPLMVVSDLGNTLPPAVQGSPYGEAPGAPATFTSTGGTCIATINGSCLFSTAASIGVPGPAFPTTITCVMNPSPNANRFSCATIASTITGTPGTYMPTVNVMDVANDTTPPGAPAMVTVSLDVVAGMMFTLITADTGTTNPCTGGTFDDTNFAGTSDSILAVNGRTYGGPNRCDLLFQVSGGRAPFAWATTAPAPAPIACAQEGGNNERFRCNSGNAFVTGPAAALAVSVMDTGSVSVPPAAAMMDDQGHASHTIGVQDPTDIIVTPQGSNINVAPEGVTGRSYGTPGGGTDLVFSVPANRGLSPMFLRPDENTIGGDSAARGFPADLLCAQTVDRETRCTTGAGVITDPAAVYPLDVLAFDNGNDTTGGFGIGTNFFITVNDEIAIDVPFPDGNMPPNGFLPNGVVGQSYRFDFTCNDGNLVCGGTGSPNNAAALYTWSEMGGPAVAGLSATTLVQSNPSTGRYFGTPTTAGSFSPTITVTDNGNATTPDCNTAGTCPTFTPFASMNVVESMALVDASNNEIDTFTTDTGLPVFAANITLDPGSQPFRIAVTPNATFAVAVDSAEGEADVINLVTGTITTVTVGAQPISVAIGPATNPLANPDSYVAYVASFAGNSVSVIDIDPNSGNFGTVIASPAITNPRDVVVTPTIDPGTGPQTRAYVLSGGDNVCGIDAEPSSGSFLTQIDIFTGIGNCIDTSFSSGDTTFVEISSDGATALIVKTDGGGEPAGIANVVSLPVSPTSTFRDQGAFSSSDVTGGGQQCFRPNDLRGRAGIGQREDVYLLCGTDTTTGDKILLLGPSPFGVNDPSATFTFSGQFTLTAGDDPRDIAFSADGDLGLVTLGGTTSIKPLTNGASTPQADVALPNVVGPDGIAHVPNPGNLRIVSGPDASAQAGNQFYGSVRVLGGVRPFTWVEPTGTLFDANGIGLGNCAGLRIDYATGIIIGTPTAAGTTCGPFNLRVTDSTPGVPQTVLSGGFTILINP